MSDIDHFYLKQEEPTQGCMIALRDIILGMNEHVTAAWRYSMPFFLYKGKRFCYLWKDKKTGEPYIGIVDGKAIHHPQLEQGNRSRMKILRVDPNKDIDVETVLEVLGQAVAILPGT